MKLAIAFGLGLLLGAFAMAGQWDAPGAEITAQAEAEAHERKTDMRPEDALLLSHPLQYDATITQSGYGITDPKTRYYQARRTRKQ